MYICWLSEWITGAEEVGLICSLVLMGLSVFPCCVLHPPPQDFAPSHTHSRTPSSINRGPGTTEGHLSTFSIGIHPRLESCQTITFQEPYDSVLFLQCSQSSVPMSSAQGWGLFFQATLLEKSTVGLFAH